MNELMGKLQVIRDNCEDPSLKKAKKQEEKNLDDWARLKKQIAKDTREIRKEIEERNALLGKSGNNAATVRMSSEIRGKLKKIRKDIETMEGMVQKLEQKVEKKKEKGKDIPPQLQQELETKKEVVKLCYDHLSECKQLESQGFGHTSNPLGGGPEPPKPTISKLPDIDDDGFRELRENDAIIDRKLDDISEGVQILKGMATAYDREIEMQSILIEENEKEVDKTNVQLVNINKRMKNAVQSVRGCDRFVLDFVLIVVILAIGLYIYNLVA